MAEAIDAEAARQNFLRILERAANGETVVVTERGRAVAAMVLFDPGPRPVGPSPSLLSLRGSGRGLWGKDPAKTIARGRRE